MNRVFVDTGGFYASLNRRDASYRRAVRLFRRAQREHWFLFTTNFVLAESHALILARMGRDRAWSFLQAIITGRANIIRTGEADERRAREIIEQYHDKDFSYCDAVSFAVVVSVPIPLRYWTAPSRDLTTQMHTIIRTTIAQFYVKQAVKRGAERQKVQPGSVTFLQRFGGALQLNVHYHVIVMEGVFLDRTDQGLKPRFVKGEPPSDADIADVVQKISRRVIRTLRQLGYLEAGIDVPVATGYDPLLDTEPELARAMAASVKQRIACGERAGQNVCRIGSGFGDEGERPELTGPRCASVNGFSLHANTEIPAHRRDQLERLIRYTARGAVSLERLAQDANGDLMYRFNRPWSDGTTGIKLSPLELLEKLAALVPLPRVHLVRYAGCLAPHSKLRAVIIPTPRQQGVDGDASKTGTPYWHWARLLGRVFDLDMATCPLCRRGALRIIAAILPPLRGRREARRRAVPTQSRQGLATFTKSR